MENKETVDKMQPTNADLMRYIIDGRKEVKQLQKNLDELTRMVKLLQKEPPRSPRLSLDANDRRRNPSQKVSMRESTKMFLLRNVDFAEIEMACDGWSDILGVGGFGEVYKGRWNGQEIAVKRLRNDKRPRDVQGTNCRYNCIFTESIIYVTLHIFSHIEYILFYQTQDVGMMLTSGTLNKHLLNCKCCIAIQQKIFYPC